MPPPRLYEVARLDLSAGAPLDLWGGLDGLSLGACYLSTGGRKGGQSKVYRLRLGDADHAWKDEGVPSGAETMAKIRDDGEYIYAFFETGGPFIISRRIDTPGWSFEPVEGPDFVGGRGLAAWPPENNVVIGGSAEWNSLARHGRAWRGNHGAGWASHREVDPGIAWELEYDEEGLLWEFWHAIPENDDTASCYFNGGARPAPTGDVACAAAFLGNMYCCGDLELRGNWIKKYTDGWEDVHSFDESTMIDHVCKIARETPKPPELWASGQDPFEVWRSFNGSDWEKVTIPGGSFATGDDTNQLTAVGYFDKRVWVAARDQAMSQTRIFVDRLSDLMVEII